MTNNNPHDVKVGQIWADNDWRAAGRTVEVKQVTETHAIVLVLTPSRIGSTRFKEGRRTRVRLDRFKPTSTGYRLVEVSA